jgi:molecular chaperone HscC
MATANSLVGIDLGTTNSLCAIFRDGKPVLVPNSDGQVLTPSVVAAVEGGNILVGSAAKELRVTQPDRCVSCFKRWMGDEKHIQLGDMTFTPIELSSFVLKSLKHDAEHFLGAEVHEAVITVPAYFNDQQRNATKYAGQLAGLAVKRILNEPTAAALTYGFHDRDSEKKLLVIDLGGGTFDVTLMEVFEGTLEIVSTAGESFLGGEDFTERLVAAVLRSQNLQLEVAEFQQPLRVARLRQLCEEAKRNLATAEKSIVRLPDSKGMLADDAPRVEVSREQFEKLAQSLCQRLKGPIGKALRDGNCQPHEVDDVIFVGGATRMTMVVDYVRDLFGKEPLATFNPDEVVALGAAVQSALIADDQSVDDMVMTDVCPFTLGIDTAKNFGPHVKSGYFTPIIHRNTTIPVSKEMPFATMSPNQREVTIDVYQGEHRRVEKNLKLGELKVTGIPPGPAGQEIMIRFSYDLSGILEVESYIPGSGKKFRAVLTQHAKHLDQKEIQEAVERMQKLKYYPREDLKNQRLLRFCERVVGEVSPFHREQLEAAIDCFESAMGEGDRALVEHTQLGLLQTLSMLGIEYQTADE